LAAQRGGIQKGNVIVDFLYSFVDEFFNAVLQHKKRKSEGCQSEKGNKHIIDFKKKVQ
jgi:hypothetical protein